MIGWCQLTNLSAEVFMKRIFKVLILTMVLLISAAMAVVAIAEPFLITSGEGSTASTESTDSRQEIERTKADADLYEVTLSEGRPILTELLRARIERYKKENNTDKATSESVIIARILAQDAKRLSKDEE